MGKQKTFAEIASDLASIGCFAITVSGTCPTEGIDELQGIHASILRMREMVADELAEATFEEINLKSDDMLTKVVLEAKINQLREARQLIDDADRNMIMLRYDLPLKRYKNILIAIACDLFEAASYMTR